VLEGEVLVVYRGKEGHRLTVWGHSYRNVCVTAIVSCLASVC
jgi:hypothetical protein